MIIINKNEMLEILKNMAKKVIKIILIVVVAIVLLAAASKELKIMHSTSLFGEVDEYHDLKQNISNVKIAKTSARYAKVETNVYADVENKEQSGNGSINIDIEAKLQEKIKKLEEKNILHTYIREENLHNYLRAFIKAEYITQYPDLRSADKIGTATASDEFQGCIQIHRALADGTKQILTYIPKSEFDSYISSNDMKAANHFSLDSEGNLIVAGWERETTNVKSNVPGIENIVDKVEYKLTTNSINYKSLVEVYTMPFDFLWTLTVMGEDEEFTYKLAQLALNSKIIFTVQDNVTTYVMENIEEYDIQEKTQKKAEITVTIDEETQTKNINKEKENEVVSYKTETIIKTETCSTNINMTYADTWIQKYENTYSNTTPSEIPGEPEIREIDDTEYQLVKQTTLASDSEIEQELLNYKITLCGSEDEYRRKEEEGKISGQIGTIYHKTYSRTLNKKITNKATISSNIYTRGTPTVTEKTNKKSAEDNFVKLFVSSIKAKSNISSITDWVFEALEKSPKAADMIDMLKYLLYKATDVDYGVTDFQINIIDLSEFRTIKGSSTENYIKAWENAILWAYETKQSSYLPTKYLTEDGLNYIVYEDGSAGHNNIAYGWATFITNSEISTNHPDYANHSLYGQGYYNWKDEFKAKGILIEDLHEGALVDKEIATDVFNNEILPTFIEHVDTYLKNNLPEYKFSQSQKDALISISYQYGNIYGFAEAYKNSLNEDGTINEEEIKTNFEVNGIKVFNYEGTKNDRKYANWLLFTQGIYIDRAGNEILTRTNLKNWDGEIYSSDKYTFPVYNQYDERWASYHFGGPNSLPSVPANKGKQKTIASSGCGGCALSVLLSGYLGEMITPDILTQKLDEVYPLGSYYAPGQGSYFFYFYDNKLLKEFGCSGKATSSREEALEALKAGYAVIGGEEGHMLTFVPVSSEDAALGYKFRIIDSAKGHNVLCKDFSDADRVVDGSAIVTSIIYPPGS